jgi:hypothetical protein
LADGLSFLPPALDFRLARVLRELLASIACFLSSVRSGTAILRARQ